MKKVEVKTPLGLETFLFLDGALVRPEDLRQLILHLSQSDRVHRMSERLWGIIPSGEPDLNP
jgi:hypothetical protein